MDRLLVFLSVLAVLSIIWCVVDAVVNRRRELKARKSVREWFRDHPEHWL